MFESNRQKESQRTSWIGITLAISAILTAAAGAFWLWSAGDRDPDVFGGKGMPPVQARERLVPNALPVNGAEPAREIDVMEAAASGAAVTPPEPSAVELEQRFRATQRKDGQLELVAEIAGHNNADAVQTLGRIFREARDPAVKEAILSGLADIDPQVAPSDRIALLQGALFGQPRNVRLTALDVLGQCDDPRALFAVRRAAREDPDQLIREAAAAIAEALDPKEP
jgi:hypothetical protein